MKRYAFTMLELIFVIVVMGILSKFGVDFLAQAYNSFIHSSINNTLQSQSESAVNTIASRLQFRIKDSIIARKSSTEFKALASSDYDSTAKVLEWIGSDIDGYRGDTVPYWSGIVDIDPSYTDGNLISPQTDTSKIDALIGVLSYGSGTGVNNAAIYFIGSNSNIQTDYGWSGNSAYMQDQNGSMHPVNSVVGDVSKFASVSGDFSGVDVYEYYQLAWTAYAVVHSGNDLTLYYDYQPWEGEDYTDGSSALIMQNVDTFRFKAIGSVVKIQVCVNTDLMEDYSLCKEKTIY